jgi:hypothetical protein
MIFDGKDLLLFVVVITGLCFCVFNEINYKGDFR